MSQKSIGRQRPVLALALLALLIAGVSGLATAQSQESQTQETEAQEEAAKQEAEEQRTRAEQELAREKEMAARHSAAARHGMLRRAEGMDRLRGAIARVAPQMRGRMSAPMAFRGGMFGSASGVAERILDRSEELGLSEAQVEQIRSTHKAHRRAEIERDAAIEIAELDLEELTDAGDMADLGAVEAKMMDVARLRVEARIADMRTRRTVNSTLTDEQREKLEEMGPGGLFRFRSGDGENAFFRMREAPKDDGDWDDGEGNAFFFDGEDLEGIEWSSPEFEWLHDGALFEALAPLHELGTWFEFRRHEDGDVHEDGEVDGEPLNF